jgi:hypothetical protein
LGRSARSRRWEGESENEALEANTEAAKGEMAQSPVKPAKDVGSSVQSDDPGRVDDTGLGQTSIDEVNIHGPDDYSDRVGYDDDQGYYDIPSDGLEGLDIYGEEYGEDLNLPMDFNDQGDIEESTHPKRGRERAESGNPELKNQVVSLSPTAMLLVKILALPGLKIFKGLLVLLVVFSEAMPMVVISTGVMLH